MGPCSLRLVAGMIGFPANLWLQHLKQQNIARSKRGDRFAAQEAAILPTPW